MPLKGPDGMRFGADGKLYLAENGAGQVDAITINGDNAEVMVLQGGFDVPTAVSVNGDTLLVGEALLADAVGRSRPVLRLRGSAQIAPANCGLCRRA